MRTIHFSAKRSFTLLFLAAMLLFLCSCSAQASILGTWRLESGRFSYGTRSYDASEKECAIEFTDNGEYIIHQGENYNVTLYRGIYSYTGQQLNLLIDNFFNNTMNYSISGNTMTLVTSLGSSTFSRVDMNAPIPNFPEDVLPSRFQNDGYTVVDLSLVFSDADTRTYHATLKKTYPYMDTEFSRKDQFVYSRIGRFWYLNETEDFNINENWHIDGIWKKGNNTLKIVSFNTTQAEIEFDSPGIYAYSYAGFANVHTVTTWDNDTAYVIEIPNGRTKTFGESGIYSNVGVNKEEGVVNYTFTSTTSSSVTSTYTEVPATPTPYITAPPITTPIPTSVPTPIPTPVPTPRITPVPELWGLTTHKLSTRSGPSTSYQDMGTYNVQGQWIKVLSRAWDPSAGIWWVKCEIPYHNEIRVLWTGYKRFDSSTLPLESIPVE